MNTRLGDIRGLRVIEPGCGSGHLTKYLADWVVPKGQVVAFDSSALMVEKARARTEYIAHGSVLYPK